MPRSKPVPEADRLAQLEARLAALERAQPAAPTSEAPAAARSRTPTKPDDDRFWALSGLQARAPRNGAVLYTGHVGLPGGAQYAWQRQAGTDDLLKLDWADVHGVIAALAHPVRLAILRATLGQARSTQELLALPGMGTSGQLFHHLKTLQNNGWLRSLQRGTYEVPGERVVPLLTMLAAAQG
jgi:Helix-turn-helix domain